jgi:hypothetical protein
MKEIKCFEIQEAFELTRELKEKKVNIAAVSETNKHLKCTKILQNYSMYSEMN